MAQRSLTRLRPVVSLLCLAVLAALASPVESWNNPYLLVQHQVYEEHQEVLAKDPSKRDAGEQRKDDEELFDFIKDYLFKRGGAEKLNNRTGNGRAQFVGVDAGSANGSAASGGAVVAKDSGQSDQRYKMHIIKFRLVNGSHPAVAAAVRNAQAMMMMHKKGEHHANGSSSDNATLLARPWSGRSSVGYRTAHPTHVTTARTETPAPPPPRRAASADNCEQPETTRRTTTTTTRRTTTRTTTTTTTTKRTTTTPKPTTTTRTTTTCAPTTVAVGCERAPPPPTTKTTTTTTTTTAAPKPYLHGHPYVVIKLHEVNGTRRVPVDRLVPLQPYLRQLLANGTNPERTQLARNISSYLPDYRLWMRGGSSEAGDDASGGASGYQRKGKKQRQQQQQQQQHPRSRRVPAYAAETAALKREVAGNLMRVLRTIRELDSMAQKSQQDEQQEEVQEQELESAPQQQDPIELVAPDTAGQIDQLLRRRDKSQGLRLILQYLLTKFGTPWSGFVPRRSTKKWTVEYPDELKENRAEEGDLHQFSILLKKALDELSVSSDAKNRTTAKPRKAAVYR
ncbi:PH domain-containing protein DDB_G0287875-like isoform X2 [Dermacentor silvarum]|uniref:PH domain-containing protein DDB_G0287875-like isoform X2 n=1 Tax=Dermacentor silvarum TaxID=543639 RepID=UPI002101BA8C|nr:PH domain-containing protein DDB_G0287875-like isoform X2 [Dermacentor silvarum]